MHIKDLTPFWIEYHWHLKKTRITVGAILQFRRALTYLQRKYPFSIAFGPCETRDACCESAQSVFDKLMFRTPGNETLDFETIALTATNVDGTVDEKKVMSLIQVFRPSRDGKLTKLDFVKSVDNVYRSYRLLLATIANSGQIDQAFERILNAFFYVIMVCVILSCLGFDPLALFISFSSVFLAFAFVFSSASAKYFVSFVDFFCAAAGMPRPFTLNLWSTGGNDFYSCSASLR